MPPRPKNLKPYKRISKRKTVPRKRTDLTKMIKNVMIKNAELKTKDVSLGKTELYHNVYANLTNPFFACYPTEGTGDDERIGDKINQRGLKVRMLLGLKKDRPNVTFKIWLLAVAKGTAFTSSELFDNTTGNVLLDSVNTDRCKTVFHRTIKPPMGGNVKWVGHVNADNVEYTFPYQFYVRRPKAITFASNGSTDQGYSDMNYFLVICSFDAYGTLQSDNVAYVQTYLKYYYKDL